LDWAEPLPVFPFISVFMRALIVFGPIKFIQPGLGSVRFRRFHSECWVHQQAKWTLSSLWDAMVAVALGQVAGAVPGRSALRRYDARVTFIVGTVGMLHEFVLYTLWV